MTYFYLILDNTPIPKESPSRVEVKHLAQDKIVNLLVENTQQDEIDLFGLEEAVKMTASSLGSIVKTSITNEDIQKAIESLSKISN